MKKQLGDRLPAFTKEELDLIVNSNDFYGMNTYTANYVRHKTTPPPIEDFAGNVSTGFLSVTGECIGPETQCTWLRPNPQGFQNLILWISKRYNYPPIIVTENGTSVKAEGDLPLEEILKDTFRQEYYRTYIAALAGAVEKGADVRGYMAWSLMDNFEWADGYVTRFGVTYVDYKGGQKRYLKGSGMTVGEEVGKWIKKE